MLFLLNQQELDCITDSGTVLGKIKFDHAIGQHTFNSIDPSILLSETEKSLIAEKLISLNLGKDSIPLPDDD